MQFEFWIWAAAWLAFLCLVVVYGFGSPWWRTPIGLTLLPMKLFLLSTLTHVLAVLVFGPYPGNEIVRIVSLGGVAVMAWAQVIVWLRIQRQARKSSCPRRRSTDR